MARANIGGAVWVYALGVRVTYKTSETVSSGWGGAKQQPVSSARTRTPFPSTRGKLCLSATYFSALRQASDFQFVAFFRRKIHLVPMQFSYISDADK